MINWQVSLRNRYKQSIRADDLILIHKQIFTKWKQYPRAYCSYKKTRGTLTRYPIGIASLGVPSPCYGVSLVGRGAVIAGFVPSQSIGMRRCGERGNDHSRLSDEYS